MVKDSKWDQMMAKELVMKSQAGREEGSFGAIVPCQAKNAGMLTLLSI